MTDERVAAVRLVRLPVLGPARLRRLLSGRSPIELLDHVRSGTAPDGDSSSTASRFDRHSIWSAWRDALRDDESTTSDDEVRASLAGCDVVVWGRDTYPQALLADPAAPAVLFVEGDRSLLERAHETRRVAIVGTRRCTEYGRGMASDVGRDLAHEAVAVVSGLALGVDAAAHRGVLAARQRGATGRPIAVVASGLDVVYPRANGGLWREVVRAGVVVTESPPGTPPDRFRFPQRNRIIAALAEVLIVVESRLAGGSMITVDEALARDVPIMAVPGPTRSLASEGVNRLIRDGAHVLTSVADVTSLLGLRTPPRLGGPDSRLDPRLDPGLDPRLDPRPAPRDDDRAVLALFDAAPRSLASLIAETSGADATTADLGRIALAIGRLEAAGWLTCTNGWYERVWSPGSVL